MGIPNSLAPTDPIVESTLWIVRFPRIAMALAVGAALAVAGAVMQAIFGNPLAEPGVVGVSSGGALGAAIAIVLGATALGTGTIAIFAFLGGLGATLLVYAVSRANGRTEVVTLLLTGIAVNAFAGAGWPSSCSSPTRAAASRSCSGSSARWAARAGRRSSSSWS